MLKWRTRQASKHNLHDQNNTSRVSILKVIKITRVSFDNPEVYRQSVLIKSHVFYYSNIETNNSKHNF